MTTLISPQHNIAMILGRPLSKKLQRSDAGFTATEIMVGIGMLCVVWLAFYTVTDWIYNTKQSRSRSAWELRQDMLRQSSNASERGIGGYQVKCFSIFEKNCT